MHRHYSHRIWLITVGITIILSLVFFTKMGRPAPMTRVQLGNTLIDAEIVDTSELQAKGLSGRTYLTDRQGMLFVFSAPATHRFWMKDMQFPIDIIWFDRDGGISMIKENISPNTYPESFGPSTPTSFVLEVSAGVTSASGVRIGDHVDFDQKTVNKPSNSSNIDK